MPKRRIDPTTGEPELTYREQMLVDEFIHNGGNGAKAAASAGYGGARPDQSAYQVLHRPEVQRRIRERIAESHVSGEEIIGTLASFMRGSLGEFLDQSGEFSTELARQKGIDHLLKTITVTTREIEATRTEPAQVVRTYRARLHPPVQAARVLARIFRIDRGSPGPAEPGRSAAPPVDPESLAQPSTRKQEHDSQLSPDPIPTQDSRLKAPDSQKSQPLPMFSPEPGLVQEGPLAGQQQTLQIAGGPLTQDPRLQTRDFEKSQLLSMFPSGPLAGQLAPAGEQRPRPFL